MDFRPESGTKITIDQSFVFMAHPAAPGFPYGQSGRRGTVYQVKVEGRIGETDPHPFHALKVFSEFFQDPRNADTALRLANHAALPGLEACYRKVIIPGRYPNLIQKYPQLSYAVLMPWVDGETWFDIIFGAQPLSADESFGLASELVRCLVEMEKRKIAHCDLSGANILVQPGALKVSMVDVEEMYIPGLPPPDAKKLPAGTPGYGHKTASRGLWRPEADRFAGAVLLGEMLGWCSETVRRNACEAQYFDIDEVQKPCARFRILHGELRRQWGSQVSDLFSRAWFSASLADCPTFEQWQEVFKSLKTAKIAVRLPQDAAPFPNEPTLLLANPEVVELEHVYRPIDPWISVDSPSMGEAKAQHGLIGRNKNLPWLSFSRRFTIVSLISLILLIGSAIGAAWLMTPRGSSTLRGRVVDAATGQPLAARVELKGDGLPVFQTANANGEYQFNNIPGMDAQVTASLKGYQPVTASVQVSDAATAQLPIQMKLTGSKITGRVINPDTGAGLPDAKITLSIKDQNNEPLSTETYLTGPTGSFEFFLEAGGMAELIIDKDGYKSFQLPAFTIFPGQQVPVPDVTLIQSRGL